MRSDLSANLAFLEQAADFSANQRADDWQSPSPAFKNSSLGQQLRHTLEHVEALLEGLCDHDINYDARKRDEQIERDPAAAAQRCHDIREALQIAGDTIPDDRQLGIRASCSCDESADCQRSTFGRELQFLVSHTVHHFAIMAGICHGLGITTPENFGVAPSTLKHRQQLAAK
jgi:hypothetical protein